MGDGGTELPVSRPRGNPARRVSTRNRRLPQQESTRARGGGGCGNPGNVLFYHGGTETRRTSDEFADGRKMMSDFAPCSVFSLHAIDPHASHEPGHLSIRYKRHTRRRSALACRSSGCGKTARLPLEACQPSPRQRFCRVGWERGAPPAARTVLSEPLVVRLRLRDRSPCLSVSVVEAAVAGTTATPNVTRTRLPSIEVISLARYGPARYNS